MIAAILIILAAIFKAVADTLAHHFYSSIFTQWDTPFWNPLHKRNDAVKRIFGYPIDAWHLAGTGMVVCFVVAASIGNSIPLKWYWQVLAGGVAFNIVFGLFYSAVFRRK